MADGRVVKREVVEHGVVVVIAALDRDGNVILVRQERTPIGKKLWELPAGGVDDGEDPATAASRELREETGFDAGRIQRLGGFYSSPGFCNEYLHLFHGTDLHPSPLAQDADESIEVTAIPLERALKMVENEEINDAKTMIGLLMLGQQIAGSR
ncbi:MAG: NUDIX hydrolase [Chloroflexi bacterium]|nr:NUDIX hydrolase [Chloroflexota bacterium]